jgi:hypothetical protein
VGRVQRQVARLVAAARYTAQMQQIIGAGAIGSDRSSLLVDEIMNSPS